MRETVANIALPAVRPPLEVVRNQFEAWRKRRPCRGRIPEALWQAAVRLCKEHSIFEVSRALRLNYRGLRDRALRTRGVGLSVGQRPDLGFVKLDLGAPIALSEYQVEMEAPNGSKMRMFCRGAAEDFDLVELGRAFWRQG